MSDTKLKRNLPTVLLIIFIILLALNLLVMSFGFAYIRHKDKYTDWLGKTYRFGPWQRSGAAWKSDEGDIR